MVLAVVCAGAVAWLVVGRGNDKAGSAATTVASTVVELTIPPVAAPPWVAPLPPLPPVYAGPGADYAVSEPLAGGLPSADLKPYLDFAQQVFDQLAADDWANALTHFLVQPADGVEGLVTVEQLQQQWVLSDRLSVLLIGATLDPNGVGYDMRVGVVANVVDGTTSVVCGHLYVELAPNARVVQRGVFITAAEGEPWFQPEDFLAQPDRIAALQTSCA